MSEPQIEQEPVGKFSDSLARCLADPAFLDRFYELFKASSPQVAERLRDTDMARQKRALTSSLWVMVMAMEQGEPALVYLGQVAERHSRRDLDIPPSMYDDWLDSLIRAAGEFDPMFSDSLEEVWRETMRFGIEFMQARY